MVKSMKLTLPSVAKLCIAYLCYIEFGRDNLDALLICIFPEIMHMQNGCGATLSCLYLMNIDEWACLSATVIDTALLCPQIQLLMYSVVWSEMFSCELMFKMSEIQWAFCATAPAFV